MAKCGFNAWRSNRIFGNQVTETFAYFIDFNLSWLPDLIDLVLCDTSGSKGDFLLAFNDGLPVGWALGLVGFQFPTILIRLSMSESTLCVRGTS